MNSKSCKEEIPNDLLIHLQKIKDHLTRGNASLMVGAGFSMNAVKVSENAKLPPTWNQLADKFRQDLYPNGGDWGKNPLQLAEEYNYAYKRVGLNQLLRDAMNDELLAPSRLHVDLLELPWNDVFTTNYDTLLERAAEDVYFRKYDCICKYDDLPFTERPRIIKLHGSFPSHTPFIITEEDYRTYPSKFAPFVNTVQQSIMEGSLCLMGFSAVDPNFLNWIGWVRDNLKEATPPIYLVGLLNLSCTEKQVLESRNIIAVDLSLLPDIGGGEHKEAIGQFIKHVKPAPDISQEWPEAKHLVIHDQLSTDKVEQIIVDFRKERLSYPGWLILPYKKRKTLWNSTSSACSSFTLFSKLEKPYNLLAVSEVVWRLKKCLIPIFSDFIAVMHELLEEFKPFVLDELNFDVKEITFELSTELISQIKEAWFIIAFGMLKFYREEGKIKEFEDIERLVLSAKLDNDLRNQLSYEKCVVYLYSLDYKKLESSLNHWNTQNSSPEWLIKYVGLKIELGNSHEAGNILCSLLPDIRKKLSMGLKGNHDFYYLSLEGICLFLLNLVYNRHTSAPANSDYTPYLLENTRERYDALAQFNCDIWKEVEFFESTIENLDTTRKPQLVESKTFDGYHRQRTNIRYGLPEQDQFAWQLLYFFEESGIPTRGDRSTILQKSLLKSIQIVSTFSPFISTASLMRIGKVDDELWDSFFSKWTISRMSFNSVNEIANSYIDRLEFILDSQSKLISYGNKNNYYRQSARSLYEMISRLTVKSAPDTLERMFDLGIRLSQLKWKIRKDIFPDVGRVYFTRLIMSMSIDTVSGHLKELLKFPITDGHYYTPAADPLFRVLHNCKLNDLSHLLHDAELAELIDQTIAEVKSDEDNNIRTASICRVYTLLELNLLTDKQKKDFSNNLLSQVDKYQLPDNSPFFKFVFRRLLVDVEDMDERIKQYYLDENFEFLPRSGGYSSNLSDPVFISDLNEYGSVFYKHSQLETSEIKLILTKIKREWDISKNILKENRNKLLNSQYTSLDLNKAFTNLQLTLANVIIPSLDNNDKGSVDIVVTMVNEMEELQIPVLSVKTALLMLKSTELDQIQLDIKQRLLSSNFSQYKEACQAILTRIQFVDKGLLDLQVDTILEQLFLTFSNRSEDRVIYLLSMVTYILEKTGYKLSVAELSILISVLEILEKESDTESLFATRPYAAEVAFAVFCYCQKENIELSPVLLRWQRICQSNEELIEVCNKWSDQKNREEEPTSVKA